MFHTLYQWYGVIRSTQFVKMLGILIIWSYSQSVFEYMYVAFLLHQMLCVW